MNNNNAPVVIFAYIRPSKLENLIVSLMRNNEFYDTKFIFYVDKYKDDSDKLKNQNVVDVIKKYSKNCNFEIHIADQNLGLKSNILKGINDSLNKYKKCIFLEDDLVVGEHFLSYMNDALEIYKDNKKVKHISGYNFPLRFASVRSSYFTQYMYCWGWATWYDRWEENTNMNINKISNLSKKTRRLFNIYGFEKDFESQLIRNQNKTLNTWAIFWFQHIFLSKGLCVNPYKSLVQNTGEDSEGVHGIDFKLYNSKINNNKVYKFPTKLKFNTLNKLRIILFYITKRFKKNLKKITFNY